MNKEFNRSKINEEACSYWDYYIKTAQLTNTSIKNMSNRSIKNSTAGKKYMTKERADLLASFLEYSDERVAKIVSGNGNIKHYLTKSLMVSVMSPRSSQNYKRLADRSTVSYDNLDDDFDFTNTVIADEYDGTHDELSAIVDEALENVDEASRIVYINRYRFGISVLQQYNFSVDEDFTVRSLPDPNRKAYQTHAKDLRHTIKMIKIYMAQPHIKARIEQILY